MLEWKAWLTGWGLRGGRFLLWALRSDNVPNRIDGSEELARYCDEKAKKQFAKGGRIRPNVLYPSRLFPFEYSVDRARYCDPWARVAAEKRWFVCLNVAAVRKRLPRAWVLASKPPPQHGEILLNALSAPYLRFATKEQLQAHATAWRECTEMIEHLADIATDTLKTVPPRN